MEKIICRIAHIIIKSDELGGKNNTTDTSPTNFGNNKKTILITFPPMLLAIIDIIGLNICLYFPTR